MAQPIPATTGRSILSEEALCSELLRPVLLRNHHRRDTDNVGSVVHMPMPYSCCCLLAPYSRFPVSSLEPHKDDVF